MKKQLLIVVSSLLLAVGSAYAQSSRLVADIPFDFVMGNKAFPAGEYTIQPIGMNSDSLVLRNADSKGAQLFTPNYCSSMERQEETKLVFNVYGDHYFLSQIWMQGSDRGRELPISSREKEEAQMAQVHHVVILAALKAVR